MSHVALASPSISVRAQSGAAGQKAAQAVADGHMRTPRQALAADAPRACLLGWEA